MVNFWGDFRTVGGKENSFFSASRSQLTIPDSYYRSASHLYPRQTKIDLHSFHTRSKVTSIHHEPWHLFCHRFLSYFSLADRCGLVNLSQQDLQTFWNSVNK